MRTKTSRYTIILLNTLLIVFLTSLLYDEYKKVGKFQWVDPNSIEDHDELFLTPIFVIIAVLGAASVVNEMFKFYGNDFLNPLIRAVKTIARSLSYFFGSFLLLISVIFIAMLLANIGSHDFILEFALQTALMFVALICMGLFGGFIVYNETKNSNSS